VWGRRQRGAHGAAAPSKRHAADPGMESPHRPVHPRPDTMNSVSVATMTRNHPRNHPATGGQGSLGVDMTEHSTEPCTPWRSPGCAAIVKREPTKPSGPPRARLTAISVAASSDPSPDASTASWSPPPVRTPHRPQLDKHGSVQPAATPVPTQRAEHGPPDPGRPRRHRRPPELPPTQDPRLRHPRR
jgi:hypothetical protein